MKVMRGLPNGRGPKIVEKEDGISALEELQFHENDELQTMSNTLIDRYFGEEYGLEEEYGSGMDVLRGSDDSSDYPPWRQGGGLTA
jgi:importin subunit alpha-1